MTIQARNLFALALGLIACSCSTLPSSSRDDGVGSQPRPLGNLEANTRTKILPLTVAEYGPGAHLLGTWEIEGHIFLTLEPEGVFHLKNFFMSGDPEPSHWLETGYWYLLAGVLYLERTSYGQSELIPAELFLPTMMITLLENDSASANVSPTLAGRTMRRLDELSLNHVENYRIARARSLSNPVDMLLPEPVVAEALKRYSEIWGDWEIDGKVSIRLFAEGKFIAFESSPLLRKSGWAATGDWYIDTDSVILEPMKKSLEQQMPAFLLDKKVSLSIVRSTQPGEIALSIGTQKFMKKLNY